MVVAALNAAIFLCGNNFLQAQSRIICDDTCEIGSEKQTTKGSKYSVVSPIGRSAIKLIQQAPRLTTLSGKTIAIVGNNFMSDITHPEIKRLILEHYPDAKVVLQEEIGNAGIYPNPGNIVQQRKSFKRT